MSAMAAPVVAVRCNFCSLQRPHYRIHQITDAQAICDYCLEWHMHALDMLAGNPPVGCQDCGLSWADLQAATIGEQVRMYVVPKDGIYQLLCVSCVRPYLPKRADLYRGTEFGKTSLKL